MKKWTLITASVGLLITSNVILAETMPNEMNDLGKITYNLACKTCHAPTVAVNMGAPMAFDKTAWNARFEKAKAESKSNPEKYKTASDYLLHQIKIGRGLMHHGGLCKENPNADCSDEAYLAAIDFMSTDQKD